jgi:polar amino acid transport system permease protein
MSCNDTLIDYGLRAIGIGERLLPKTDFTLCEQFVLIGSGMLWNLYFAVFALGFGFMAATGVAVARASSRGVLRYPAQVFIFVIRGSPLFIQFFIAYESFVLIPKLGFDINLGFAEITVETRWLTKAWLGALLVLFLNTTAYTAQIFHGALMSVPKGDIEAADAIGMSPFRKFRRVVWPSMLRLAWASYTNEAIFLFHATALVFFSSFPAWRQEGDALYYANYFADKTFNPFIPYPIIAVYFVTFTLILTLVFGLVNRRLNRHLRAER